MKQPEPPSFNPCRVFSGLATKTTGPFGRFKIEFQSLSGFFRPCNSTSAPPPSCLRSSFNPCRVFSGLATSANLSNLLISISQFQSLSGFFRPCNFSDVGKQLGNQLVFQSLSGFFRPCNFGVVDEYGRTKEVSIPVGFFQALQLRVTGYSDGPEIAFQSLSGFFRPCNGHLHPRLLRPDPGFNPCRVFSGLATGRESRSRALYFDVSIPVGFFQALQPVREWDCPQCGVHVSIPVGFFQALQLIGGISRGDSPKAFQSLSGFFRPCNLVEYVSGMDPRDAVSIPVGFFQALQPLPRGSAPRTEHCFNPCRVFSGLATIWFDPFQSVASSVSIPVGFFQALQPGRS